MIHIDLATCAGTDACARVHTDDINWAGLVGNNCGEDFLMLDYAVPTITYTPLEANCITATTTVSIRCPAGFANGVIVSADSNGQNAVCYPDNAIFNTLQELLDDIDNSQCAGGYFQFGGGQMYAFLCYNRPLP